MGNFYVNFAVKRPDQKRVVEALKRAKRTALVTPVSGEYVVVYDEESDSQNTDVIMAVGKLLSREAGAPVLAVLNHDDDVLCYWLFEGGQMTDTYNSCPDYFGEGDEAAPMGGGAKRLCTALSAPGASETVESLLKNDEYVFAVERHAQLAEALGLPQWSVGSGFGYVDEGELPDGLQESQLVRVD